MIWILFVSPDTLDHIINLQKMSNTVILVQTLKTLKSYKMMPKNTEIQNFMRLTPQISIGPMAFDRITIDRNLGFEPRLLTNGTIK